MSVKKPTIVSENTLVPISFLILILIGALRVESTSSKSSANSAAIKELKDDRVKISEELKKHGEALARIEGALGTDPDKK